MVSANMKKIFINGLLVKIVRPVFAFHEMKSFQAKWKRRPSLSIFSRNSLTHLLTHLT